MWRWTTLAALVFMVSIGATGGSDVPPSTQIYGYHSGICLASSASGYPDMMRDYELAEVLREALDGAATPSSVKVFFNSCFGGGMLDDIATMLGEFDPAIRFVGGSASTAYQVSWGPSDDYARSHNVGCYWTNSLHEVLTAATVGDNVFETVWESGDKDPAASCLDLVGIGIVWRGGELEVPQCTSAHGGRDVGWGPEAQVVVFSGDTTRVRHANNVNRMTSLFRSKFGSADVRSSLEWGGASWEHLVDMINDAADALEEGDEFILYVDDHGCWCMDMKELISAGIATDYGESVVTYGDSYLAADLAIPHECSFALYDNLDQGNTPTPYIYFLLSDDAADAWQSASVSDVLSFSFNGNDLALPVDVPVMPGKEIRIPIPFGGEIPWWAGARNSLAIDSLLGEDLQLDMFESIGICSGLVNQLEVNPESGD